MVNFDSGLDNNNPPDSDMPLARDIDLLPSPLDSDSEPDDDDDPWGNYMPLPQNPDTAEEGDILHISSDENDEEMEEPISPPPSPQESLNGSSFPEPPKPICTEILEEVWTSPQSKVDNIELNESKIDTVKQLMASVSLPPENIPQWAKDIPEENWAEHLFSKINQSS